MSFFSRLRKSTKNKSTVDNFQDNGCYENSGYAAPSLSESAPSMGRLRKNGLTIQMPEVGSRARPILKRSETFTLKDGPPDDDLPEHLKCGTYTKKKKEPLIKTDVFEAMYTKRPTKLYSLNVHRSIPVANSSNLKTTSPRSIGLKTPRARPLSLNIPTNSAKTATNKTHSYHHAKSFPSHRQSPNPSTRSPNLRTRSPIKSTDIPTTPKPREYLFGTTDHAPSQENVQNKENEDRFKTITLRDVRRSFREKYLNNDKSEERKHQPIWFVDVKNNGDVMRPESNVANRRSQTRSVHENDQMSLDRDTIVGERSRSNSYRSNDSAQLRRSPSLDHSDRPLSDRNVLQRSSSICENNGVYLTYKKGDYGLNSDWSERGDCKTTFSKDRRHDRNEKPVLSNESTVERDAFLKSEQMDFDDPVTKPKVTVNRKNTFKVVRTESSPERPLPGSSSLKRRETFVINEHQPKTSAEPQRGYYLNRYRRLIEQEEAANSPVVPNERPPKVVPIGIAAPYNSRSDFDEYAKSRASESRSRFAATQRSIRDEPDVRDESPPLYESTAFLQRKSPPLKRQSPVRKKSPEARRPSPDRRCSPELRSPSSPTKKLFISRSSLNNLTDSLRKPIESVKISFESLRKPASPQRDPSQTNLGFDRFYDPNYYVPKNQNLFGPLASAHLRQVNVVVQPKKVHDASSRSSWLYNKQ